MSTDKSAPAPSEAWKDVQARLDAATTHDIRRIRYDHGGGRMYRATARPDARYHGEEERELVIDAYGEANREFYFHAADDVKALLAKIAADAQTIATLTAEIEAYRAQCSLLTHKVITCGVAATHPNADLTKSGAYSEKWDSPQAQSVRDLRARAENLTAELTALKATGGQEPRCDCGRALTCCSGCAVEDYQASNTDCPRCCVDVSQAHPAPTGGQEPGQGGRNAD